MKRGFVLIVVLLCTFLVPFSGQNEAEAEDIYLAGDEDDFANFEALSDVATPSDYLRTAIEYRWYTQDFDLTAGLNGGFSNKWIAHTFYDLPLGIESATLEFQIKAGEDDYSGDDDFWILFYDEDTDEFDINKKAYRVAIGNRGGTTEGLSGDEWNRGSVATIILDLSALPLPDGSTISVIEEMENFGFIDVIVTDDTAVDFYRLTIQPTTLDDVLDFFDDSIENNEIAGNNRVWWWQTRFVVSIMRQTLVHVGNSIEDGRIDRACFWLQQFYLRCDGEPWPRDVLVGPATEDLAEMVIDLMENLGCE